MSNTKLYLIGSLRNKRVPELAKRIRKECPDVEVFDDWFAAGPEADDFWKEYEGERGRTYQEALQGHAARNVFAFDKRNLDDSSHAILVLPAGKSGHMEIMYATYGVGAKTAILLDPEDVRWDVMYQFVPDILNNDEEAIEWLKNSQAEKTTPINPEWNYSPVQLWKGLLGFSASVRKSMTPTTGEVVSNTLGSLERRCDTSRRLMTAKTPILKVVSRTSTTPSVA